MRKHKLAIAVIVVLLGGIGWYLFRPERLFINQTVNEGLAGAATNSSSAQTIASGRFHSVAHEGHGQATIYQLAGGKRVLRFTDFETSNGPDVQVYLVAAADATDSETVKKAGYVHLGALKYRAATVWCRRFGVNFATAPLAPHQ